jgi:tetratricopeptide (TPR) repeat protein
MTAKIIAEVESIAGQLISTLEEALKVIKTCTSEGQLARGKIYQSAGLLNSAVECYEAAAHVGCLESLARLAISQLMLGNIEAGLDAAVKLAGINGDFRIQALSTNERISAMAILGDALLLSGREDAAASAYEAALKSERNESYAAGRLAHLLIAQGKGDKAIELRDVIGDNPRFSDLQNLLQLTAAEPFATPLVTLDRVRSTLIHAMPGRPLLVDGFARVAPSVYGTDWRAEVRLDIGELTDNTRERAGMAWEKDARNEHASIATFAQFILQLLSLGAPANLVDEASQALQEEIAHAKLAFGVASELLAHPTSVGRLNLRGVLADESSKELLRNVIIGGCVGETIASLQAAEAASSASNDSVRKILLQITEEEARHSELAWQFLSWLLNEHPGLVETAKHTFSSISIPELPVEDPEEALLAKYGQLTESAKHKISHQALQDIIKPRAVKMLSEKTDSVPKLLVA